jgi:lysophospholipase L1-like esterase
MLQASNAITSEPDTLHKPYTLLALGDSYTIGESVPGAENFPNQTVAILRAKKIMIDDPDIIARTGWTTTDLINAIQDNPPQHVYSFVTLLIGVNNQYQGRTIDQYKNEFTILLNNAIKFAGNRKDKVYVLSIPDYSVTVFASKMDTHKIVQELQLFNELNKTISLEAGVNYIDITGISRSAISDQSLIAGDGLHPSASQYKKWADLLAERVIGTKN